MLQAVAVGSTWEQRRTDFFAMPIRMRTVATPQIRLGLPSLARALETKRCSIRVGIAKKSETSSRCART